MLAAAQPDRTGPVKADRPLVTVCARAVVCAALLLPAVPATGQAPAATGAADQAADAVRAEGAARRFEAEARVLMVFDREGRLVKTVGERAIYHHPIFSPDGTRIAVVRNDPFRETSDVFVIDVATGRSTRITAHATWDLEWAATPAWSPDGTQLAYIGMREGYEGVYRKAASGEGPEDLLYRHPGANLNLTDWSIDGRSVSFSAGDATGGALYVLPMDGEGERQAIEVFRTDAELLASSFSADGRYLSYSSDASGRSEVYVRSLDPAAAADAASADAGLWQVSERGGEWAVRSGWRQDGGELYYVASDGGIMAVEVDAGPTLRPGAPTLLFRVSEAVPLASGRVNVSRDGERVVIAVPHAPSLRQIAVFDRQGNERQRVGEPGRYVNPAISPDGTRVAVARRVPETNNMDIWTFDIASGTGRPLTDSFPPENGATWSPDGNRLVYDSRRGLFSSIYRRAADGSGEEELLYRFTPGAFLEVTDWSADGRFLTFQDGCWGVLHVLPLEPRQGALAGEPTEWLRDEYLVAQARFSPDSRFIAYLTDEIEADVFQLYVSPFDLARPDGGRVDASPVRVSSDGALGMVSWREDGRELYYLTRDWEVMAVDVATAPALRVGTPRLLFAVPGPLVGNPKEWKNVSPDGRRFVFTLNVPVSVP